jgi:hypothetical protein
MNSMLNDGGVVEHGPLFISRAPINTHHPLDPLVRQMLRMSI